MMVLILVVVDNGLVHIIMKAITSVLKEILILVVVDNGLVPMIKDSIK